MPSNNSLEEFSKEILGRKHRLTIWKELMKFTIEPPVSFKLGVIQDQLTAEHDVARSATYVEFESLRELGMIEIQKSGRYVRSAEYIRVASPIWDVGQAALIAAETLLAETAGSEQT
jgi:hypothetical protein